MEMNPYQSPADRRPPTSPPVRIKVYGFISLTRSGYLTLQLAAFVVLAIVAVVVRQWWPQQARAGNLFYENVYWILGAVALLEVGETWMMMRKYKAKQSDRS
jgi:hypothetical protein